MVIMHPLGISVGGSTVKVSKVVVSTQSDSTVTPGRSNLDITSQGNNGLARTSIYWRRLHSLSKGSNSVIFVDLIIISTTPGFMSSGKFGNSLIACRQTILWSIGTEHRHPGPHTSILFAKLVAKSTNRINGVMVNCHWVIVLPFTTYVNGLQVLKKRGKMANPAPILTPATVVIFGSSGSGKTFLTAEILKHRNYCFDKPVQRIHVFYACYQRLYQELERQIPNISFFNCLPDDSHIQELSDPNSHDLIVLDDWAQESAKNDVILSLFVRDCHHKNISLIMLTQQLFYPGISRRTQSLNTTCNIFMKNRAGADQVSIFARQRFPNRSKEFMATYDKVTSKPFSYLMVDCHARSDPQIAIRTGIFPDDNVIVYQFNNS